MKRLYTCVLCIVLMAASVVAQSSTERTDAPELKRQLSGDDNSPALEPEDRGTVLWSDDFSDLGNWVIENQNPAVSLDWQIGVGLVSTGSYTTDPVISSTASNGYAMIDSDGAGNVTGTYESNTLTTALPIDLSAESNVILQFENHYRRYTDEMTFVVISTDGVTWPVLDPSSESDPAAGVYRIFDWDNPADPSYTASQSVGNPYTKRINISQSAGGQAQVWVRFHWTGIWGYSWFLDDVEIQTQDDYDIGVFNGFVSHTGTGEQYGRIPLDQLNGTVHLGATVINQGLFAHNNVIADFDNGSFVASTTQASLSYPDSMFLDELISHPALTTGLFTNLFSYTSDEAASDPSPNNDTWTHMLEITDDVYSLDNIGNHDPMLENLSATGTNSFGTSSGAVPHQDGVGLATVYYLENDMTVTGLWVGISSESVAGAIITPTLSDTVTILNDDFSNPLFSGDDYVLTQADIDAGFASIPFKNNGTNVSYTLTPGAYYAALVLHSNSGANHVSILDDVTLPQPEWASVVNTFNSSNSQLVTYSNGIAFAIRLLSQSTVGVGAVDTELSGINVYPNPTDGMINISASNTDEYTVEVHDLLGGLIATGNFSNRHTMDLSGLATGMYSVRVSNGESVTVRMVNVK